MAQALNVICLISGGKDSFYSLLHCLAQGHRVVALANLHPPDTSISSDAATHGEEDLNSYMYQSAGHALIPLYADLLPFPLYRAPITGTAVDQGREYAAPNSSGSPQTSITEDETEALVPLLQRIMTAHPEANALSTGAIQSTYQRTRVESVCTRLGLISLAYLWQYDVVTGGANAARLLEDIEIAGLDARIVKVACGGLDESVLWASLADEAVRKRLRKAVTRFGGSILGEGGEFESLVIAGPPPLWRGRIAVDEKLREVVFGGGGEAYLAFRGASVVLSEQQNEEAGETDFKTQVHIPEIWDARFREILLTLEKSLDRRSETDRKDRTRLEQDHWVPQKTIVKQMRSLHISNLAGIAGRTVQSQMTDICRQLHEALEAEGSKPSDVVFTTILLRSMNEFGHINPIYGSLFVEPIPPARVTLAVGDCMPPGLDVMLSVTASIRPRSERRGLHVQSRSYWAPANIGPYSQAVSTYIDGPNSSSVTYVAGQIPLVPATMSFLDTRHLPNSATFLRNALLSVQHLWRIGAEMGPGFWAGGIAFLASDPECARRAQIAFQIWQMLHTDESIEASEDSDEYLDLWEERFGAGKNMFGSNILEERAPKLHRSGNDQPWFLAIEIEQTPRECSIEWQGRAMLGHGDVYVSNAGGASVTQSDPLAKCGTSWLCREFGFLNTTEDIKERCSSEMAHTTLYTSQPWLFAVTQSQLVPCKRIWGAGGREIQAALVIVQER